MVPLASTTARAQPALTGACEAHSGRLGASWRAQGCWRPFTVAPRRPRRQQQRQRQQPARAALLDPPPFDPSKLRVEYLPGGRDVRLAVGRRYTLTHNDVTGSLQLSIGREYNRRQLDGWYTRIVRDEILAEWQDTAEPLQLQLPGLGGGSSSSSSMGGGAGAGLASSSSSSSSQAGSSGERGSQGGGSSPALHVFCHVSGEELWPAPPALRSFIFQREMTLVLDTIAHAEGVPGGLLAATPSLARARVYVHLRSDLPALDRVVEWGVLGERSSWRTATSTITRSLLSSVLGTLDEGDLATDGSNGSWSRTRFTSSFASAGSGGEGAAAGGSGSWDEGCGGGSSGNGASGGSSEGAGEVEGRSVQAGQAVDNPQQQQQQQGRRTLAWAADGGAEQAAGPPPAIGSVVNGNGSSAISSGNGAPFKLPASSPGSSSPGSSSGGSSPRVGANGAVGLAAAQQAAERAGSWLGAPAGGDASQRRPAVEVAASRKR